MRTCCRRHHHGDCRKFRAQPAVRVLACPDARPRLRSLFVRPVRRPTHLAAPTGTDHAPDRHTCPECGADLQGVQFYRDPELTEEANRQWKTFVGFDDDGMKLTAYVQCPACDVVLGGEARFRPPGTEEG